MTGWQHIIIVVATTTAATTVVVVIPTASIHAIIIQSLVTHPLVGVNMGIYLQSVTEDVLTYASSGGDLLFFRKRFHQKGVQPRGGIGVMIMVLIIDH